ncbi:uncharacterized protein ARMOST_22286 [Armillaria ostoyae]|uniref:F-box domain-containing protein n=1 Tax=Armillaria ostoyae TaxID=47428 RepID=A0A284SCG0_ARMOS|nr:uncharacterized protein ARMOST_22286 [Armillaria ostoyae]
MPSYTSKIDIASLLRSLCSPSSFDKIAITNVKLDMIGVGSLGQPRFDRIIQLDSEIARHRNEVDFSRFILYKYHTLHPPISRVAPESSLLPQFTDRRSDIEELPLELFEEILSFLDIPSIKKLGLASPVFHATCLPRFFRSLALHGDRRPTPKFLDDFKGWTPVPCLRKTDSVKVDGCPIGNTTILPSLNVLRVLELANLTFSSVVDYFGLLASLSQTVNELKVRRITFRESESTWIVGRRIQIERLETDSDADLAPLLRDDCPVSIVSLRVASLQQPNLRDLEDLVRRTPLLIDLSIDIDGSQAPSPASFPLTRLKSLSIVTRTTFPTFLLALLSMHSDDPAPLEELTITFPIRAASNPSVFQDFVAALTRPRFWNLKTLNLRMLAPLFYAAPEFEERFDRWTQQFELEIEASRTGPMINVTAAMVHVGPIEHSRGFWFGDIF